MSQKKEDDAVQEIIGGKHNKYIQPQQKEDNDDDREMSSIPDRPVRTSTLSSSSRSSPTKKASRSSTSRVSITRPSSKKASRSSSSTSSKNTTSHHIRIGSSTSKQPDPPIDSSRTPRRADSASVEPIPLPQRGQSSGTVPPAPTSLNRNTDRTAVSRPGAVSIPASVNTTTRTTAIAPIDETNNNRQTFPPHTTTTNDGDNDHDGNSTILVNARLVTSDRDLERGNDDDEDDDDTTSGISPSAPVTPSLPLVKAETMVISTLSSSSPQGLREHFKSRSIQIMFAILIGLIIVLLVFVAFDD